MVQKGQGFEHHPGLTAKRLQHKHPGCGSFENIVFR